MANQSFIFIFENKKKLVYHYFAIFLVLANLAVLVYTFYLGQLSRFIVSYSVIAIIDILLTVLYLYAKKDFTITITEQGINFSGLPQKKHSWMALKNLVLKDGLLTIDYKNNTILQQVVPDSNGIQEKDFNEFCKTQLNQANKK